MAYWVSSGRRGQAQLSTGSHFNRGGRPPRLLPEGRCSSLRRIWSFGARTLNYLMKLDRNPVSVPRVHLCLHANGQFLLVVEKCDSSDYWVSQQESLMKVLCYFVSCFYC